MFHHFTRIAGIIGMKSKCTECWKYIFAILRNLWFEFFSHLKHVEIAREKLRNFTAFNIPSKNKEQIYILYMYMRL